MPHTAAARTGDIACVVCAGEAIRGAIEPIPTVAEVHAQIFARREFHTQFRCADVFIDDVIIRRPRPAEAVEALKAVVGAVVRIAIAGGVAVKQAHTRFPRLREGVAQFSRHRPRTDVSRPVLAKLPIEAEIVIEACAAVFRVKMAVGPQTGRMHHALQNACMRGLMQSEVIRLQRELRAETAPVTDRRIQPLLLRRPVPFIKAPRKRLHGEQIELPVVAFLSQHRLEALERVRGVAPLVVAEEAAVEELEIVDAVADAERSRISTRVIAEQIAKVELAVEPDELEFVHVAIVARETAAVAARVLHFDRETKRIDHIVNAEIRAGAVKLQGVESIHGAADVIVAVFMAEAVIEPEIEPRGRFQRVDARVRRMARVFRQIRVPRGAVAPRRGVVALRRQSGERGEEQKEAGKDAHEAGRAPLNDEAAAVMLRACKMRPSGSFAARSFHEDTCFPPPRQRCGAACRRSEAESRESGQRRRQALADRLLRHAGHSGHAVEGA